MSTQHQNLYRQQQRLNPQQHVVQASECGNPGERTGNGCERQVLIQIKLRSSFDGSDSRLIWRRTGEA
jgi:hypothetical protein